MEGCGSSRVDPSNVLDLCSMLSCRLKSNIRAEGVPSDSESDDIATNDLRRLTESVNMKCNGQTKQVLYKNYSNVFIAGHVTSLDESTTNHS